MKPLPDEQRAEVKATVERHREHLKRLMETSSILVEDEPTSVVEEVVIVPEHVLLKEAQEPDAACRPRHRSDPEVRLDRLVYRPPEPVLQPRPTPALMTGKGRSSGRSSYRFTPEQIEDIVSLRRHGFSIGDIANAYGVSAQVIKSRLKLHPEGSRERTALAPQV